jgi:hypothetical protein
MSIYNQIDRIKNSKKSMYKSITNKGIDISQNMLFDNYANVINNINTLDRDSSICIYGENNKLLKYVRSTYDQFHESIMINNNVTNIIIGNNITNIRRLFSNCINLTCSPVCGNKVVDMSSAYYNCYRLKGSPVCGDNVINMSGAYHNCYNLTGSPVCGNNVTSMSGAYYGCTNLTGSPVCGSNVTSMSYAYYGCTNLTSNAYFYSSDIESVGACFGSRDTSKRLNLYVPADSITLEMCLYSELFGESTLSGIEGDYFNEDNYESYGYYDSPLSNIYIYPVANVAAARAANKD